MGACKSNTNSKRIKANVSTPELDEHSGIRQRFQKEIKANYFFTCNISGLQEKLVTSFENTSLTPNNFIETQGKYSNLFKKQFTLSYLKCEPLLNNVFTTHDKESQLLFLNLALFFLSNGGAYDRKIDLANKLILECYDYAQKKHNLGRLKEIIRNVINIALVIVVYFGAVFLFLDEATKNKIFVNDENVLVENKYDLCALDNYFFDKFTNVEREFKEETFYLIWEEFLLMPLNPNEEKVERSFDGIFTLMNEGLKEEIKFRLCHMFDPFVFFEVFIRKQVPVYNVSSYKNTASPNSLYTVTPNYS